MPGPDVSVVIEQREPLARGYTRPIIGDGEADMMVFFPGPPLDHSLWAVMDGFDRIGGQIPKDRLKVVFVGFQLQLLRIAEEDPQPAVGGIKELELGKDLIDPEPFYLWPKRRHLSLAP